VELLLELTVDLWELINNNVNLEDVAGFLLIPIQETFLGVSINKSTLNPTYHLLGVFLSTKLKSLL